jgi:hypothetical protein
MFIQAISNFIHYLNTDNHKLDNELKAIIISLNRLIETIETIGVSNQSKSLIGKQISELEKCLTLMIGELKLNRIESVINSALELARNANELFLTITKPILTNANTINSCTKFTI